MFVLLDSIATLSERFRNLKPFLKPYLFSKYAKQFLMSVLVNGNLTSKSRINVKYIIMLMVEYITYRGDYITLPFWFLFIIRSGIENDRAVAPYSRHAHPMCICGV